jgi:hypothetical protein
MTPFINRLNWSYRQLLRLYPPRFRATFSEEMAAVFGEKLNENGRYGNGAILAFALAELRDLPLQVIREHLHERRRRLLATNTGVIVMELGLSLKIFRFFGISLFVILTVFTVMVVLPFFALGLQSQTPMEVISGSLGPEAWPPYSGSANPLPDAAVFILLGAPIWNAVFGLIVLLMLAWFWKRLLPRHRLLGFAGVVAAVTPTLFILLPVGYSIRLWWFN